MKFIFKRSLVVAIIGIAGALAVACTSNTPAVAPTPTPVVGAQAPIAVDVPTPDARPTPSSASTPIAQPQSGAVEQTGYDPNQTMFTIFPGFALGGPRSLQAMEDAALQNDTSQVPVLVESMRFMSSQRTRAAAAAALQALTGQSFTSNEWGKWAEWYGKRRDEFPPPSEYLDWKINMMSAVDTRFVQFLRPARDFTRIDLTEVVWGGVLPDGIPDLRNPKSITPEEADYLLPTDRVFGVSINGENKAYPLRIVNAHEMANDVVGGEPIALAW